MTCDGAENLRPADPVNAAVTVAVPPSSLSVAINADRTGRDNKMRSGIDQDGISPGSLSRRVFWTLFVAFACLTAIPIVTAPVLPLVDYHNHLVRIGILADHGATPQLAQWFIIGWDFVAALAMDLLVPPLVPLIGLEAAGRSFVLVIFLLLAGGTVFVNQALYHRRNLMPLCVFFLLYNGIFLWGFLNYLFGIAAALWAFGAWIRLRDRSPLIVLPLFSVAGFLLLAAHLYGLCLYAVLVGIYELVAQLRRPPGLRFRPDRRLIVGAAQFVIPVSIFFVLSQTGAAAGLIGGYDWHMKTTALFTLVHFYERWADVLATLTIVVLAGIAITRGWLRFAPFVGPLAIVLTVLFVAMPNRIFDSVFSDYRMPVGAAFLLVATVRLDLTAAASSRVGVVAAILLGLYSGWLTLTWQRFGAVYQTVDRALDLVPPGKKLLVAVAQPSPGYKLFEPPLTFYPLRRILTGALFVNGVFIQPIDTSTISLVPALDPLKDRPNWKPIYFQTALDAMAELPVEDPGNPFSAASLEGWDYLLVAREQSFPYPVGPALIRRFDDSQIRLYQIR